MRKSLTKSHWGEFPDVYNSKIEVQNVFSIFPPEKRSRMEILGPVDESSPEKK